VNDEQATGETPVLELTVDACWAYLRSVDLGRLAVAVAGTPEIFPVNFVVDHGTIVFRTAAGTKLAAATVWPAVAFEVDGHDAGSGEAWSVVVKGIASELKGLHELLDADELPLYPEHASPKHRFVRIVPDAVSGRRFATVPPRFWSSPLRGARRGSPE
jgi:nitroimidazol reductase NimA-like FMN-containing flavoprotein (pyridoxamine 5'-phosphate oxidase superfamily)